MLEDILTVGRACRAEAAAERTVATLRNRVEGVRMEISGLALPRVFCADWYDPIFASGHWVPEMVRLAGGADGLGSAGREWRKIEWDSVVDYDREILVLIPCGFGVERAVADIGLLSRLRGWRDLAAVKNGMVLAADGPRFLPGTETGRRAGDAGGDAASGEYRLERPFELSPEGPSSGLGA